ncbi:MAG: amidohydrolase [Isosphaeraceae bacterium]|nr:amidohydrolase [Isosphaeraceae bacterium]
MADWRELIDGFLEENAEMLGATRRHLHSHPEPSREEFETAAYLARRLEQAGVPHRVVPSGRGVIAEPFPQDPSARVAIRADIDALRLQDAKDVPYRSTRDGVMHACGHDAHATMALAASLALWHCRERLPWSVPWRAIFQPAEELGEGALEMIADGAVEGVRAIVALHVDPEAPVGRVGQKAGPLTAFCQELEVDIQGRGGHAARPHQAIDPIAVAVQFVSSVYQFIPRAIDARDPVVVTFGSIRGGANANVIPENVVLLGTIRALSQASATRVGERVRRIAQGLSEATGAAVEVILRRGLDGVVNDPAVTATCVRAAGEVVGPDQVDSIALPSMGGEDFAGYLAHAPGCLLRLGVARDGQPRHLLHSPHFDIDERALIIGAKLLARCAVLLSRDKGAS